MSPSRFRSISNPPAPRSRGNGSYLSIHRGSRRSAHFGSRQFDSVVAECFILQGSCVQAAYIPPFLLKHGGYLLSVGQFTQWAGSR
jgi:hypothetical protein